MALITCPECGREISDQATSCPQCGYPLSPTFSNRYEVAVIGTVPKIERKIFAARIRKYYPDLISEEKAAEIAASENSVIVSGIGFDEADIFRQLMQETYRNIVVRKVGSTANIEEKTRCPRCGSTSIQMVRKGFSFGKATIGNILFGPVGSVAGLGSDKYQRLCCKCGCKF